MSAIDDSTLDLITIAQTKNTQDEPSEDRPNSYTDILVDLTLECQVLV